MDKQNIIDAIDPELVDRLAEHRTEIDRGAYVSPGIKAALAIGSVPIALAALSRVAGAQTPAIKNVLDFALALEIFENEFYKAVLGDPSSPATQRAVFNTVRPQVTGAALATLQQIQKHEAAHVAILQTLGATNVFALDGTTFDYTGGKGSGTGPFSEAGSNLALLLEVAQGAEDTGVRAYKGQAGALIGDKARLEGALRIHSVEARHASRIRRIRRIAAGAPDTVRYSGTVRGGGAAAAGGTTVGTANSTAVTAAFEAIYGAGANTTSAPSEANTTQATVNIMSLAGAQFGQNAATEAFDEPLDRADVVKIVQPFFTKTIS